MLMSRVSLIRLISQTLTRVLEPIVFLHYFFINRCGQELCLPLCILFNKYLKIGTFLRTWKMSNVTPVFKSGDRNNVCNYRPISILNIFAKIFESIVYHATFSALKHLIIPQHMVSTVHDRWKLILLSIQILYCNAWTLVFRWIACILTSARHLTRLIIRFLFVDLLKLP